jgi:hypothetical protein
MTQRELDKLNQSCLRALETFSAEARETVSLLRTFNRFPVADRDRTNLLAQRVQQNDAQVAFHEALEVLFRLAQWGEATERVSPGSAPVELRSIPHALNMAR